MGKYFLFMAVIGVLMSFILMIIIFIKNKTINLHQIWQLASDGQQIAKLYCYISLGSFISALIGVLLIKG